MSAFNGWLEDGLVAAAPSVLTDVTVSSTLTPAIVAVDTADIVRFLKRQPTPPAKPGVGSRLLFALKPTVKVRSQMFGDQVVAPYGVAKPGDYARNMRRLKIGAALILIGLIGTGFVIGAATR